MKNGERVGDKPSFVEKAGGNKLKKTPLTNVKFNKQ
jgi:hypothetical protein